MNGSPFLLNSTYYAYKLVDSSAVKKLAFRLLKKYWDWTVFTCVHIPCNLPHFELHFQQIWFSLPHLLHMVFTLSSGKNCVMCEVIISSVNIDY